jgi:uroporphyrinogen decarboxylase
MAKTKNTNEILSDSLPLEERKAVITRFSEKVGNALLKSPPTKDFVKNALRRKGSPRCVVRIQRNSLDVILRYGDDLADLFSEYPDNLLSPFPYDIFVGYQKPDKKDYIDTVKVLTEQATWIDEWGTGWGHAHGGVGATTVSYPIKDWSQLDDYLKNQFPDPRAAGRLDVAAEVIKKHGKTRYIMGANPLGIFERLHSLRGMEETLMDFYTNEREIQILLERLTEYHIELFRYWSEIGADGIFIGDDVGCQRSMMISADMWRKILRPHYKKIFDDIHRCGMEVIYHSCGNIMDIIPDLIDLGADVLDPIQPAAMDAREIARRFGGKIAFYGGINDQELANWTQQQVKDEVRRMIDTVGKPFGNAYMVAPANVLTPEIPLENLRALCEACYEQ